MRAVCSLPRWRTLACALIVTTAAFGCGAAATKADPKPTVVPAAPTPLTDLPLEVVATVGDYELTNQQLFANLLAARKGGKAVAARDTLDKMVTAALFATDAKRLGLDSDPRVVTAEQRARRGAAKELLEKRINDGIDVEEAHIRRLFHQMRDTVEIEAIVLATESSAAAARARVAAGAELAAEAIHSLDPRAAKAGGDLGAKARFALDPALAEAAFSAPLNELFGPIKTTLGWTVARVRARNVGSDEAFARERPQFETMAHEQLVRTTRTHIISRRAEQARAALDQAFLESTGASLTATDEQLDHVVTTIDGKPLLYRDVLEQARWLARGQENSHNSGPMIKRGIVEQIIERSVLEDEAIAQGLGQEPEALAAVEPIRRATLARVYEQQLRDGIEPATEADARAYYDDNPSEFERLAQRTVAHILLDDDTLARSLLAKIQAGESFAELARDYSLDARNAAEGGSVGPMTDAQLEQLRNAGELALAAAIAGAEPGKVAGPVKSADGWHLIVARDYQPAAIQPFEAVQGSVMRYLGRQRAGQAVRERVASLRESLPIQMHDPAVERALAAASPRKTHP